VSGDHLFYVATDYARKEEADAVATAIEQETPLRLRARWIRDQPLFKAGGLGGELYEQDQENARLVARQDLEDINAGNVFVQLTSGEKARGGRHVELGFAICKALGHPAYQVVAVGPREHAFHYHPRVIHLPTAGDLLHWAKGYSSGARL
jgi:hypothetical protein